MSSFKRKSTAKQSSLPRGTQPSPSSLLTTTTSTGIPSLDDILGGGLPLSCSLLIIAPDTHSAYGELVQKYFIAQGLACGQKVCIVDDNARDLAKDCMWMPGTQGVVSQIPSNIDVKDGDDDDDESTLRSEDKIKIAWRYEQMKQFQTTVASSTSSTEEYCRTFDLTCRIPPVVLESAHQLEQLSYMDVTSSESTVRPTVRIINEVTQLLQSMTTSASPIRICIPSLGSPQWDDVSSQEILLFMHSLRGLFRLYPLACASICLPPQLSTDAWGPGWTQKLGWLSDSLLSLSVFTANPSLSAAFPAHHGLLKIHKLPAPHTLLPPSDKFSVLRGLSSSAASTGSGENNLAFKCTRKRLLFETLHLDLDGGVGERRTTPSSNAMVGLEATVHSHGHDQDSTPLPLKAAFAAVEVEIEVPVIGAGQLRTDVAVEQIEQAAMATKPRKPRKKVAFHSDRPDLYDF